MLNKREVKKIIKQKTEQKTEKQDHHTGKGTMARIATLAERYILQGRNN